MAIFNVSRGHIGLDIGTSAVRAAEIRGDKNPSVVRFGQVLLPRGAVQHGEVHEVDLVAQALSTLWKRAGFGSRAVRIGAANRRVVVRQLELPAMNRDDLAGAIRFQAQDYIPIPLSEAVMDFEVLDEFPGNEGEPLQRVLVVAAERAMIDPLVAAVRAAKLEPEVLEFNAYPLVRALGDESAVATEAEALVDIGGGVTNIVIHQAGRIRFTRTLPTLGGDEFTEAIAESLGIEWDDAESLKHRVSGTFEEEEEAEEIEPSSGFGEDVFPEEEPEAEEPFEEEQGEFEEPLEEFDIEPTEPVSEIPEATEPLDDAAIERARAVLDSVLQRFVGEVRGSVDFYTTQSDPLPLARVVLTGGGSLLSGLPERLSSALRIPAERGRVFERVPVGKVKLSPEQIAVAEPFLTVSVGLALGGLEG